MENQSFRGNDFSGRINQIIEEHIGDEHFSVEDLARLAGLSRSMLHRKLMKLTGKSATDLITEIRLNRAKELLENNVATVSEIAYKVGFSSVSYFHRVFKKHYKISPGEVKKSTVTNPDYEPKDEINQTGVSTSSKVLNRRILIYITLIIAVIILGGLYFLSTRKKSEERSIAVLPLQNLTGHNENEYFVEGMHDALTGELGKIGSMRVVSRASTLRYRNSDLLLKDIAHELGVNTIVEGSVFCAGDSLCFLVQLIDVYPKERHIMTNEYYDDMPNVLTVQYSAVRDIAQKIKIRLSKKEEQRLAKPHKVNPETYKAYLRGMYYLNKGTAEEFDKGISYLQEAMERDPEDPFAYAYLALGYATMGHGQISSEEAFNRAMSAANKAIELDPGNDEAHTALAITYLYTLCDWPKAKEAFEKALANNPNNDIAHYHFAWYYVLFNDREKAIYHGKQAIMIEPFSPLYLSSYGLSLWDFGEYDEAEYWVKKALAINNDNDYGNITMSWLCLQKKQYRKAIEYIEKLYEDDDYYKMLRGYTYVKAGQRDKALKYWREFQEESKNYRVNPCYTGMMAAYLGFTDKAFELLNDACDHKDFPIAYINFYPCTENIRSDPRYDKILQRLNVPAGKRLITSNQ